MNLDCRFLRQRKLATSMIDVAKAGHLKGRGERQDEAKKIFWLDGVWSTSCFAVISQKGFQLRFYG